MKAEIIAILGNVNKGKKKEGSGMVKACVQYETGENGVHVIYSEELAQVASLRPGDVINIEVKMEEFAFLRVG